MERAPDGRVSFPLLLLLLEWWRKTCHELRSSNAFTIGMKRNSTETRKDEHGEFHSLGKLSCYCLLIACLLLAIACLLLAYCLLLLGRIFWHCFSPSDICLVCFFNEMKICLCYDWLMLYWSTLCGALFIVCMAYLVNLNFEMVLNK